jgi:hypothetical protein
MPTHGTGTATASDGDDYDFEFCAGPFGFRSRPMNGAGGLMLKARWRRRLGVRHRLPRSPVRDRAREGRVGGVQRERLQHEVGQGRQYHLDAAGAGKVQLAGTDHPAPKFDLYQDKVNKLLKVLSVIVLSNCDPAGGPLAGTLLAPLDPTLGATNADALAALILALAAVADFQSTKVTNG